MYEMLYIATNYSDANPCHALALIHHDKICFQEMSVFYKMKDPEQNIMEFKAGANKACYWLRYDVSL